MLFTNWSQAFAGSHTNPQAVTQKVKFSFAIKSLGTQISAKVSGSLTKTQTVSVSFYKFLQFSSKNNYEDSSEDLNRGSLNSK